MVGFIFNNFWSKIISLVLAVATWFYVFDLVTSDSQGRETVEEIISRSRFIVKTVPVRAIFAGESPEEYRVVFDEVVIKPSRISILGPESVLEKVNEIKTDTINVEEYTRPTVLRVGISSGVKALRLSNETVSVTLPVKHINEE